MDMHAVGESGSARGAYMKRCRPCPHPYTRVSSRGDAPRRLRANRTFKRHRRRFSGLDGPAAQTVQRPRPAREVLARAEQGDDHWSPGRGGTDSGVGSKRSVSSSPAERRRRNRDAARRNAVHVRREVRLREREIADSGAGVSSARVTMYAPREATASAAHSRVHGRGRVIDVQERAGYVLGRMEERSYVRAPLGGRTNSPQRAIRAGVRCGCKSDRTVEKRGPPRVYARDASISGQQEQEERRTMLESRAMKRPSRRFRSCRARARVGMRTHGDRMRKGRRTAERVVGLDIV
jgi:hypothetical protein